MSTIVRGSLLIADPFLKDPNFQRTVVLLCEHQQEGSMGFILNRPVRQTLRELVPSITQGEMPVGFGGPVQLNSLHFIHHVPDLVDGALELFDGIYWGGDFEKASYLVNARKVSGSQIRFFCGYSGWSNGQLEEEFKEKSWIISKASPDLIFDLSQERIWKEALNQMGSKFAMMANFPMDPTLN